MDKCPDSPESPLWIPLVSAVSAIAAIFSAIFSWSSAQESKMINEVTVNSNRPYISIIEKPVPELIEADSYRYKMYISNVGSRAIEPGAQIGVDILSVEEGCNECFKKIGGDVQPFANLLTPHSLPEPYITGATGIKDRVNIDEMQYCLVGFWYEDEVLKESLPYDQHFIYECANNTFSPISDNQTWTNLKKYFYDKMLPELKRQ